MRVRLLAAAALAVALTAAPSTAQAPPAGYLGRTSRHLPHPAAGAPKGSVRYAADRKMFAQTRKLQGQPRWDMAAFDDTGLTRAMGCAVGVELGPQSTPKILTMIRRVTRDSAAMTDLPKDANKRLRPFLVDKGAICIEAKRGDLTKTFDYPSGHVTAGWTMGLVFAELAPDRATDILIRARAFGESRMVCGVHNMSAVEAGRTNGSIVVAALHGSKEFRDDLEAARVELAEARRSGPKPTRRCARRRRSWPRPAR
jgi:acid phosphatase (class A)